MNKLSAASTLLICAGFAIPAYAENPPDITPKDIVNHCNYKNPGNDQETRLTILLIDKDGNEKKNVYHRLWKNFEGKKDVEEKMVLFTEFPPDAEGVGFMRWGYTLESGKNADQWLYLPSLKKIRRVSVRDPGDSFLGSDLSYFDISGRPLDADDYKLIKTERSGNNEIFTIESTARTDFPSLYSRVISHYVKDINADWETCVKQQAAYFDQKGQPFKQQEIKWQQVDDAWVWDEMKVKNVQTGHSSVFQVTDVKINVGLKNNVFSERYLRRSK